MNRVTLNADVLLAVFSLAGNQTKLALMSTCQALYRQGGKQFLKSVDVKLDAERRVESFHRFMEADGGSRGRFLRRLYIDLENPSKAVGVQLKTMLTRLTPVSHLMDLNISHLEPLLSVYPPLSRTIATLTSLKNVSIRCLGERSLEMLGSMQSKLTTVRLDPVGRGGMDYRLFEKASDRNPITLLRQFSSSLCDLSLVVIDDTTKAQDDAPQYPLLSSLTLEGAPSAPITWHYARAFPNLKTLTITGFDVCDVEDFGFTEFRMKNRTHLHEHGCWTSLDMFDGPIVMLWLLGLPCPVRHLQVSVSDHHDLDEELTADMIREALSPARPTRLGIAFYGCRDMFMEDGILAAIAEGCGATLRELGLTLEVNVDARTDHGGVTKVLVSVRPPLDQMARS